MSITDPNTILIVGAGASVPFGLPLGGALIELIRSQLDAEITTLRGRMLPKQDADFWGSTRGENPAVRPEDLLLARSISPEHQSLIYDNEAIRSCHTQMTHLRDLLTNQTSQTIDDFIAINPSVAHITKIGIATVFFHRLYTPGGHDAPRGTWARRSLSHRQLATGGKTSRRNWVHHLINLIRHNNFPRPESPIKVNIINFNYDGIIETILEEQFENTEATFGPWQDFVNIIHPHGFMGAPPTETRAPPTLIQQWADSITVVKEAPVPKNIASARSHATALVKNATEVYMAGFAISGPNATLLGLGSETSQDQKWYLANYDGSSGLRRTALNYARKYMTMVEETNGGRSEWPIGAIDVEIEPGTPGDPLHIDTWFEIGIPGEMPS